MRHKMWLYFVHCKFCGFADTPDLLPSKYLYALKQTKKYKFRYTKFSKIRMIILGQSLLNFNVYKYICHPCYFKLYKDGNKYLHQNMIAKE